MMVRTRNPLPGAPALPPLRRFPRNGGAVQSFVVVLSPIGFAVLVYAYDSRLNGTSRVHCCFRDGFSQLFYPLFGDIGHSNDDLSKVAKRVHVSEPVIRNITPQKTDVF